MESKSLNDTRMTVSGELTVIGADDRLHPIVTLRTKRHERSAY